MTTSSPAITASTARKTLSARFMAKEGGGEGQASLALTNPRRDGFLPRGWANHQSARGETTRGVLTADDADRADVALRATRNRFHRTERTDASAAPFSPSTPSKELAGFTPVG